MSPLKHILRLEVSESANSPYHQLVLFKHSSVFINDAEEAGDLLTKMNSKGLIYDIFRYVKTVPDMLASDGENWSMRSKVLRSSLEKVRFDINTKENKDILNNLQLKLKSFSESGEPMVRHFNIHAYYYLSAVMYYIVSLCDVIIILF